jgi:hypothetical protein
LSAKDQVIRPIVGPNRAFICDEYVRPCNKILAEDPRLAPYAPGDTTQNTETHDLEGDQPARQTAREGLRVMRAIRLFFRGVCILCGVLGFGILILAASRGGALAWLGVACLLVGLVVASFVMRRC